MTYDKTEMNAFVQNLYDQKMQEGKHGHYETMFHVVHAAIAAHTAKLLADVEMPEEFTVYTEDEPNSVVHGYTKDQLQQYAAACAAQAREKALDEAKQACLQKHANGNWKYDTREECADAIESLKGKS